jgi:FKBP12-rapamycin complex-associated protein
MLIHAMEVTGIEGTYRCTCESVMTVLRNNKDSLMAVLEAFVYDPLLNWRLIETGPKSKKSKSTTNGTGPASVAQNQEGLDASLLASGATDAPNPLDGVLSAKKEGMDDGSEVTVAGSTMADLSGTAVGSMGAVGGQQSEGLNKKALDIVQRVRDKLTGRDFNPKDCLSVKDQVDLLICQATNNENLCQCYIGWCPFW